MKSLQSKSWGEPGSDKFLVRDTASGYFVSSKEPGHGNEIFVADIEKAAFFETRKNAEWLAVQLSHDGRVCEVCELDSEAGGRQ